MKKLFYLGATIFALFFCMNSVNATLVCEYELESGDREYVSKFIPVFGLDVFADVQNITIKKTVTNQITVHDSSLLGILKEGNVLQTKISIPDSSSCPTHLYLHSKYQVWNEGAWKDVEDAKYTVLTNRSKIVQPVIFGDKILAVIRSDQPILVWKSTSSSGSTAVYCGMFGYDTWSFIQRVYTVIRILVPVLIIVLGIIDFLKVVFTGEDKDLKTSGKRFLKRIIAGIVFLLLPILLQFVMNLAGFSEDCLAQLTIITQNFIK